MRKGRECIGGTEMRSGLLFTTTEGHFLTRFFLEKEKKKGSKERRSWSVKEVTRTQANEAKGVNDPSRIPGLTRIIVFHRLGVTPW